MRRFVSASTLMLVMLLVLAGCGQGTSVEQAASDAGDAATKGVEAAKNLAAQGGQNAEELMANAEAMIDKLPAELKAKANEYREKILAQQEKLGELKSKMAEMAPKDLLAGEGRKLKDESEAAMSELSSLQEKLKGILDNAEG